MKTLKFNIYPHILLTVFSSLLLVMFVNPSYAQKKKNKGDKKFKAGRYEDAIKYYKKNINEGKELVLSNFMIGEAYRKSNRVIASLPYYKTTIEGLKNSSNKCCNQAFIHYAQGLKSVAKYDMAVNTLDEFLNNAQDSTLVKEAKREVRNINMLKDIKENAVTYRVKNLDAINTAFDDYSPYYHKGYLYFTSNAFSKKKYKSDGTHFTNIYRVKTKGAKVDIKTLEEMEGINSINANDASLSMTKSGRYQVFAKGNTGKKMDRKLVDIFARINRRGKWGAPFILNLSSDEAWDSTPYIVPNGKTVYFASNRPGGYGGIDLYSAKITTRGKWKFIKNLGKEINTKGNEMFPYVAIDGTIYFASTGHPGFGGLDIFKATLKKGKYQIENLGTPINSPLDDFGIFFYNQQKGFLSSNREGGKGRDDIYTFVDETPDKKTIAYFLNITTYEKTAAGEKKILPATKVNLLNVNNEEIDAGLSDKKGKIRFSVSEDNSYFLVGLKNHHISKREGWTMEGRAIPLDSLKKSHTYKTFNHDMVLEIINLEKTYTLKNILYDFDKATLKEESKKELENLVQILKDSPHITVELSSHTDNIGTEEYNIDLSQKRAESAVRYILSQNISHERISARGYGETKPVADNTNEDGSDNPEGRKLNRRTEFKITSYKKLKEDDSFEDESTDIGTNSNTDKYDDPEKEQEKEPDGGVDLDINDLLDP